MLIALLLALTLDDPAGQPGAPASPAPAAEEAPVRAQAPQGILRLPTKSAAPAQALQFVWGQHPSLRAGQNVRLDFGAKLQRDARDPGDDPVDFKRWELHRARVSIDGEVFRKIQFSIEREFSENLVNDPLKTSTKSQWKDVYVELNLANAIQIRGGKFKIPYGLDQTSGESNLDFVYRSLGGDYLSPGRDKGIMVHGRFFGRGLNYWVGGFEQDGENSRSGTPERELRKIIGADRTIAARLTTQPFAGTEIGGSFATSELSDESVFPNGLRARTVMSQYTFFDPVFVKGTRRRYGVDADWTGGPFGSRAEYMFVSDTRENQGFGNNTLSDVMGHAWYVLGTWVLSGEKKVRPVEARGGGLGRGGVGAIELAARFDRLWFDSKKGQDTPFRNSRAETILPSGDKVWTVGLTYYVNRWVKLQLNGIHEQAEDVQRSPTLDGSAFWSTVLRFQFEL